ncbi:membrane protein US8A [Pteropodid alphaherpesvirus 1]|uniref:Membrane protein US8A n=1 Tax=Pteropodid alphaherpesvirus 1 TaxID=1343901 RepID=A0A060Q5B0_9ALPH|nr:membrane protein US8A [Pteropodid alphaherpesvirus 1]BAP00746.1 membrane protein US8A [Pteropodid alphaherpesvirus 1]
MDPMDIVTSRPPIRLARGGKAAIASPATCSRRFSREQMAVGRELVNLAEAVAWPSPTPPPETPPPTPSSPLYSGDMTHMTLAHVDPSVHVLGRLLVHWSHKALGLGAVLCGVMYYVTSGNRGA